MLQLAVIALMLFVPAFPCAAAEELAYLVLAASGGAKLQQEPVSRGMAIPATAVLVLPVGSSVTVIGERGKLVMNGAFEGTIANVPTRAVDASDPPFRFLASLLMRVLPFAERGGSEEGGSLWAIRPDTPGVKCVIDGQAPSFQVPSVMLGRTATIVHVPLDRFVRQQLTSRSLPWPPGLPVSIGTEYRVSIPGTGKTVSWQLAVIDGTGQPDEQTLAAMDRHKCTEQLHSYALQLQPTAVLLPTQDR